jgi:hypothetical protein
MGARGVEVVQFGRTPGCVPPCYVARRALAALGTGVREWYAHCAIGACFGLVTGALIDTLPQHMIAYTELGGVNGR